MLATLLRGLKAQHSKVSMSNSWTTDLIFTIATVLMVTRCEATLKFLPELTDTYVVLGKPLWWTCSAISTDQSLPVTYIWRFQDGDVSTGQGRIVYDNGTLYFPEVQSDHLGQYTCVASNSVNLVVSQAWLREAYITDFLKLDTTFTDSERVFTGGDVVLECIINAGPPPKFVWTLDGKVLEKSNTITITEVGPNWNMLKIKNVSYSDAGTYRCNVSHPTLTQPRSSRGAQLSVYGVPVLVTMPRSQTVPVGYNVTLECGVQSIPASQVQWQFQASERMSPLPLSSTQPGIAIDTVTGSLQLQNLQTTSSGIYTCQWSNEHGSVVTNATITVNGLPRAPIFDLEPSDTTAVEGDDLSLNCSGNGNPEPDVTWIHPSGTVLTHIRNSDLSSVSQDMAQTNEEMAGRAMIDESGALVLSNVTRVDFGTYTCKLDNIVGEIEARAFVDVFFKPDFIVIPQSLTVKQGSEFTLPCGASGNPEPTLKWSLPGNINMTLNDTNTDTNDNEVVNSDGALHVVKAGRTHQGTYTCRVSNVIGRSETSVFVTVVGAPQFTTIPMSQGVIEGDKIHLHCEVSAYPLAGVQWYYKYMVDPGIQSTDILQLKETLSQKEIPTENMIVVQVEQDPRYSFMNETSLQIVDVRESDAGLYICMATNDEGSVFEPAILRVITFPVFQVKPRDQNALPGSTVKLDCFSVGIPVPSQRWLFKGGKLTMNSRMSIFVNGSLVIKDIQENELGVYTCLATNQAGQRSVSATLSASKLPVFVDPPMDATAAVGSRDTVLSCRGNSPTSFNVTWYSSNIKGEMLETLGQTTVSSQQLDETASSTEDSPASPSSMSKLTPEGDLLFTCIETPDASWYICSLTNSEGTIHSNPAYLTVNHIPDEMSIKTPQQSYNGLSAKMSCEARGSPSPTISWVTPLKQELRAGYVGDDVEIQEDQLSGVTKSTVDIKYLQMDRDAGGWFCKACNVLGCRILMVTLNIDGRAVVRQIVGTETDTEYSIACVTTGQPEPEITYLSGGLQITDSTPGHRVVDKILFVQKDQIKSSYTCKVKNIFGELPVVFFAPSSVQITSTEPASDSIVVTLEHKAQIPHLTLSKVLLQYKTELSSEWQNETHYLSNNIDDYIAVEQDALKNNKSTISCESTSRKKRQTNQKEHLSENVQVSIISEKGQYIYSIHAKARDLRPNTQYEIRAALANVLGSSPYSFSANVLTLAAAPSGVTNVRVDVNNRTATVSWSNPDPLNGRPEDTAITVKLMDGSLNVISEAFISAMETPSASFQNLQPGHYTVKVTASNMQTNTTSDEVTTTFQVKEQQPQFVPEIDYIRAQSSKSIYLNWTVPSSPDTLIPPVSGYVVHIWLPENNSEDPKFQKYLEVSNSSISSMTIDDLQTRKEYSVRVASSNEVGTGPYSDIKYVKTPYAEFSEDAMDGDDLDYNISWRLLVIILICICSALVILTVIVVVAHQVKMARSKSVPITRESDVHYYGSSNAIDQNNRIESHIDGYTNDGFIMY